MEPFVTKKLPSHIVRRELELDAKTAQMPLLAVLLIGSLAGLCPVFLLVIFAVFNMGLVMLSGEVGNFNLLNSICFSPTFRIASAVMALAGLGLTAARRWSIRRRRKWNVYFMNHRLRFTLDHVVCLPAGPLLWLMMAYLGDARIVYIVGGAIGGSGAGLSYLFVGFIFHLFWEVAFERLISAIGVIPPDVQLKINNIVRNKS